MKKLREKIEQSKQLNMGSDTDLIQVRNYYDELLPMIAPLGPEFSLFKLSINSEMERIESALRVRGKI